MDFAIEQIRQARRMVRESRNELRKATGNPIEPLVFRRLRSGGGEHE